MEIKVLGAGCSSCSLLYANVEKAVGELELGITVEYVHDIAKALAYEVMQMPALIVNEKVVSYGENLSVDEVKVLLAKIK